MLMRLITLALPLTFALASPVSYALNLNLPTLGDQTSATVSLDDEGRIGDYMYRSLSGSRQVMDDPILLEYASDILFRLAPYSDQPNSNLRLLVMNSAGLNAFAVPGGLVGLNAGLLLYTDSEDQFASVIAHELAHLSQRHYALRKQQERNERPLWIAATVASILAAAASDNGQVGGAAITTTVAAAQQRSLAFSRLHEQEADRLGMQVLASAGFSPYAMPGMLGKLNQDFGHGRKPPEMLLTHPLSENRVADTLNRASQYPRQNEQQPLAFQIAQVRAKVLLHKNPRALLLQFQEKLKPTAQAAQHYGLTLAAIHAKQPATAAASMQWLLKHHPFELSVQYLQGEWLLASDRFSQASQALSDALALSPGHLGLSRLLAEAYEKQGNLKAALQLLEQLSISHSDQANVWYDLSEIRGKAKDIEGTHLARIQYFLRTASWEQARKQVHYARNSRKITPTQASILDAREQEAKEWEEWEKGQR